MNAKIEITKGQSCEIKVTGLEVANELYSTEISDTTGEFTYLDTLVINGLYKVDSNEEKVLQDVVISKHEQETINNVSYNVPDSATFKLNIDGEYEIIHVIIPLKTWVDEYITTFGSSPIEKYSTVYVSDGINFYSYDGTDYTKISADTILENYSTTDASLYSTVCIAQTTFSMCNLEKCLFNIDAKLLHEYCPSNCDKTSFQDLIWKRDFLWMAKYVMTYLLEKGNFMEALRIMELFQGCNDFCKNDDKTGGSNCGCGSSN